MGFVSDKKGISNRGIKTYQTHLRETRPKKTNHSGELPPNVKEMGDAKATDPDNPKIAQKSCRCPGHLPVLLNLNLPIHACRGAHGHRLCGSQNVIRLMTRSVDSRRQETTHRGFPAPHNFSFSESMRTTSLPATYRKTKHISPGKQNSNNDPSSTFLSLSLSSPKYGRAPRSISGNRDYTTLS